nr:MAG TPA: hypothetical protein [Caudoviricetes sp.]
MACCLISVMRMLVWMWMWILIMLRLTLMARWLAWLRFRLFDWRSYCEMVLF